jgi:PAS domain-containing protein
MKPPRIGPFPELALEGKSGLITRRWLRAVQSVPAIEPAGRLTTGQLVDRLPSLYEEICTGLRTEQMTLARLVSDARKHGRDRWMRGYRLDELFRELNQLQRRVQRAAREFFAGTQVSRNAQATAHQLLEDLFSAIIHTAISQLTEEQDGRISATIDERDRVLAAQQKSDDRLRMAASAAELGIFEWNVPTRVGVWENRRMYEITGQRIAGTAFMQGVCA